MRIFLWILQGVLALLCLAGGAYKFFKPSDLAATIPSLPIAGWKSFGVVEVMGALLLVLPVMTGHGHKFTPLVATALAVESLVLAVLYARQSWAISAENPLVWAVAMTVIAGVVAYARSSKLGSP